MNHPEKAFLAALVEKGARIDGRKPYEYRPISIETGVIPQANGSARVRLGKSEVIVGIKIDALKPFPDSPASGILMTNAELQPLASNDFQAGPPSEASIEISRVIDRAIRESKCIDFSKMVIKEGELVWTVFIDVYPISYDGNLFDAGLLGAVAALKETVLPKYDKEEERVLHKEHTKNKLPLKKMPLMCTFGKVDGKTFLDPTSEEEKAMDARLSVGVLEDGRVCAMQKGGVGTFTKDEIVTLVGKAGALYKTLAKSL